jgi:hypothetical protein
MAKQKPNRVAWRLAAILAVVLLRGVGPMLTHGVFIGNVEVRVRRPVLRPFGPAGMEEAPHGGDGLWAITRSHDLGLFVLEVTRCYYQQDPPPN